MQRRSAAPPAPPAANPAPVADPGPGTDGRLFLLYVLPALLLLLIAVLPLIGGQRTLFLRDVLNVHFEMKWTQAEAMRQGYLPLIDPHRSGGQPLLGNPNAAALYPDSLLLWVAPPLWALNAHFWLHLLLAPWTFFWMARAWGLERRAAWGSGLCYAASGYFLSNLNLYNLMAGATWAPALAAAALGVAGGRRPGGAFASLAAVWALLLLGGDPMTAALALALALAAVLARSGLGGARWARAAAALGLGTLLAAPQIVEFLRILPQSFRGHWRFSTEAATAGSWHPATAFEWLLPLAFGRPDLSFWGRQFYSDGVPLFFSLYPGALALALVAASGRPRSSAARWAWGAVAAGIFLSLGRFNPLMGPLLEVAGAGLLRLPVKFWLAVAMGAGLLCGLGLERLLAGRARRPLRLVLGGLALFHAGLWLLLASRGGVGSRGLRSLIPSSLPDDLVAQERLRWSGICLIALAAIALLGVLARLSRRSPWAAPGALLATHVAVQLVLLRPLMPTDRTAFFDTPPPVLEEIPLGARVVQGDNGGLFGQVEARPWDYPDSRLQWLQRQTYRSLHPYAAVRWGRHAEFAVSPEGLDTFLLRATAQAFPRLDDAGRLRLLEASGVGYLLLGRALDPAAAARAELLRVEPTEPGEVRVYRLAGSVDEARFVGRVWRAPHLNAALERLTDPHFDGRRATVLAGGGPELDGAGGRVEVVRADPERIELEVEAASAGALVLQRAFLPIYRARIDGARARPVVADLHRLAVEMGPGRHRVEIWVDRRPLHAAALVALLAAAAVLFVALRPGRDSLGS